MKLLMKQVHLAIDAAAYTHRQVPLSWLKAMDHMEESKKDCLTYEEVTAIARQCSIPEHVVQHFLSFLHDMGHLMWHNEADLRDVVILDAVSFLVTPATIIICNLNPTNSETTQHITDDHLECARKHNREWRMLKETGILNTVLLPILWKKFMRQSHVLLSLMVKFGLLVYLRAPKAASDISKQISGGAASSSATGSGSAQHQRYLVPTLLPLLPAEIDMNNWTDNTTSTCFFVFTLSADLSSNSTITQQELRKDGFLPSGMFERLIGKSISWAQSTAKGAAINLHNVMLFKDVSILQFGGRRGDFD
eukprot:CAMPEP_0174997026 /NCGR_PEP_ID=MMETSP0005-20121125/723_1 /TAXON_ID=420556 /ORGANISM="Ochromonas sp., Strain CCMP1393" /LENGTH=306 /DNA_ID=CAMNT_0016251503 /DNA_START=19 /DNA_END=939 /DNA_ORIENTATION=+